MNSNPESERKQKIHVLLRDLNHWEQNFGVAYTKDKQLASSGEVTARIADLKRQLKAQGARYHWNGEQYVLDAVVEPNQGQQGEDELPDRK